MKKYVDKSEIFLQKENKQFKNVLKDNYLKAFVYEKAFKGSELVSSLN